MKILAIETSCDETAIALLDISGGLARPNIKILGNTLLSQIHLHQKYGGVYPNLAKREHEKNLPILLEQTLKEARENIENPNLDYIAVTAGPGLEPALWTGIEFAQELGRKWRKPVVGVNHMEGHIYSVLYNTELNHKSKILNPKSILELPALALLISGGHTELVHVKDFGNYTILGQTRDDAVGEAFDKVARMLELPYPGGPEISKLAEISRTKLLESSFQFPRPMIHSKNLDFSFSGLKTAVLYKIKSINQESVQNRILHTKEDVARAFEDAAVGVLVAKTHQALLELGNNVKTLIIAGGVSANIHLAREFEKMMTQFPTISLKKPVSLLTTDNAIMIGIASFIKTTLNPDVIKNQTTIKAQGNLSIVSDHQRHPI